MNEHDRDPAAVDPVATGGTATPGTPVSDTAGATTVTEHVKTVPLAEERVLVGKRTVERTGARIALTTHEETVEITEPLKRRTFDIERIPADRFVDEPPEHREEADGTYVVPVVEEVLVKRYHIIEEIRFTPRTEVREHRETVTLRRQDAVIETEPDLEPDDREGGAGPGEP